jgi:hypothetical protein
MKLILSTLLMICCSVLYSQSKLDSLIGKEWKYESYVRKGIEVKIPLEKLKYTL